MVILIIFSVCIRITERILRFIFHECFFSFLFVQVVPRNLIFAHGAKVVDIACALDATFDRPNVVSLAENG